MKRTLPIVAVTLVVGLVIGRFALAPSSAPPAGDPGGAGASHDAAARAAPTVWTCSMHPQIRLPEPGKCPICFMDLIPLETDDAAGDDGSAPRLSMSEASRELARIRTVEVVRDRPFVEVRLVGEVAVDETRVATVTAWAPGRLDRLYVDYTGIRVSAGDHLAEIYSPDLLTAEGELVQALRSRERLGASASETMRGSAVSTVEAAREKLRLLGLTAAQIADIERDRDHEPRDHFTLWAPASGVVIEKNATAGDWVDTGTAIYRTADLSSLWVLLDAHESDLSWIRYGQDVAFEAEAIPGETFRGKVAFIAPTLDPGTRTVKVRLHVANPAARLKPGMFVRATILAEVDAEGNVVGADLAGMWICPMHPEIVKRGPGACDVCGMDLVPASSLGWVAGGGPGRMPLLVPRSAILFTGKRAIVYVEVPDAERPTYEGREIVLGPRAGDRYVVRSGLAEGERVVAEGAFRIDSALQIQAKPSMMSAMPTAGTTGGRAAAPQVRPTDVPAAFRASLEPAWDAYFALAGALAADDVAAARAAADGLAQAVPRADVAALDATGRLAWAGPADRLVEASRDAAAATGPDPVRAAFQRISDAMIGVERSFGHAPGPDHVVIHCPMAFDDAGADWVQPDSAVANPYFGAAMPRCGAVRETFAPTPEGK